MKPIRTKYHGLIAGLVLLMSLTVFNPAIAQQPPKKQKAQNTAIREDIQRFLGYERPLLFRYLSVPYDVTMTTNVNAHTIDIGFFLLLFLPLALFLYPGRNAWQLAITAILLLLFLIIAIGSAYLGASSDPTAGLDRLSQEIQTPGLEAAPLETIFEAVQYFCLLAYAPLHSLVSSISGNQDRVTYPILILLLIGGLYGLSVRFRQLKTEQKSMVLLLAFYGFLWWILSPGLSWYGFLLFGTLPIIMLYAWTRKHEHGLFPFHMQKALLYSLLALWLLSSFCLRMANNGSAGTDGKAVFYLPLAAYRLGSNNSLQVLQSYRPGYPEAAAMINEDPRSLVYQVGTQLGFFIKNNDARCFLDTFLEFGKKLTAAFRNKQEMIKALKASGFRYIVVDLSLPQSDKTPDKSLTEKFQNFMNYLYLNPEVELLVTDRKVRQNETGDIVPRVFLNDAQLVEAGTFAVYRIK